MAVSDAKARVPLPPGAYPIDGSEVVDFLYWPGRKINRYGLIFDGVDDYVNSVNFHFNKEITYIFSFKILNINENNDQELLSYRDNYYGSGGVGFNLRVRSADSYFAHGLATTSGVIRADNSTINYLAEKNGIYNFITKIYAGDGTSGSGYLKIYDNNNQIFNTIFSGGGDFNTSAVFKIATSFSGGLYSNIEIYFIALYNRALSDDEITAVYNYLNNNGGYLPLDGLILLYDFTEHGSSTLYDKSGWKNHGTIYGAQWLNEPSGVTDAFIPVVRAGEE